MIRALALLSCAALTACGGGSGAMPFDAPPSIGPASMSPVPTAPAAPACVPKVVSIAIIGDSTNFAIDGAADLSLGWSAARAPHSPDIELQALMDATYGVGAVVVTNYAVPGSYAEMAPKVEADVIVENYGVNDKNGGFPLNVYAADILATGATIVETQFPSVYDDPREQGYVETVRHLGLPVVDVNAYIRSLPNWQSYYPNPNSAHVTDELYKMITDNMLAPAVMKQVAPLRCAA